METYNASIEMVTIDPRHLQEALDRDRAIPSNPMQVVHAKDLTTAEKRTILRSWETDACALQRADDEGMQIGERSRLHDVEIALACLDAKAG